MSGDSAAPNRVYRMFTSHQTTRGEQVMYAELSRELENLGKRIEELRVSL
ncbi:hypothetical protein SAMN02745219_00538 [Desulfofundulus thermosubterraneus DSM 16057]|uniref:Uncharacterized protein n=1 Tax=Desulfofundulus thermosubterraneus DSM 16057 TaxID=1121432 RepID=A0A1M6BYY8_9FIRM|nr:hypothetical protein SAMN02745219_00538 [Desulfofundulus thermosubterraneus DSM 16057]